MNPLCSVSNGLSMNVHMGVVYEQKEGIQFKEISSKKDFKQMESWEDLWRINDDDIRKPSYVYRYEVGPN